MINKKAFLLLSFLFILPFSFNAFLQFPISKLQIIIPDSSEDLTCIIYYETTNKSVGNLTISLTNGKTAINNPSWYNSGIQHTGLVIQCPPYYSDSIIISSIKQEEDTSKFTIQNVHNPEIIDIDNDDVLDLKEDETSILDNCLFVHNPEQSDCDTDNIGDVCDQNSPCSLDSDSDGIYNNLDNCDNIPNPEQSDCDTDNIGDVCDDSLCSIDSDSDEIFDDVDTCRLTPTFEKDQIYTQTDSEWYGCSPSERDLDEDTVCDGPLDLTQNYNNPSNLKCSPGPDFCPGVTGTYCKGCPNFCESPAGKIACTTISCDTSNRLEPPTCNQLTNSPCGTNQCTQKDNYCTEGSDGFYYCTPPTQEQICVSDENNQHGYCMDTECLVPDEKFDLFCEKEQECVNDNDNDGVPNILDCNPNDNVIGKCTGCSVCSEQKCVPSDSLCEPTTCSNGCGVGDLIEFNITYVGTSVFNSEVSLSNTCSTSNNNSGVCSHQECQIQTKIYSKTCDPDWDNDKICNGNVSIQNVCSISPTGKDECPELNSSNSVIGCPDVDNDGVHDGIDVCPYTYSPSYVDYNEYPSCKLLDNGCISNDTDKDGVCDELEKKECIKSYPGCNYINDGVNNVC